MLMIASVIASVVLIILAIAQAKTSSKKLTAFFLAIGIICLVMSAGKLYLDKTHTSIDVSLSYDVSVSKTK